MRTKAETEARTIAALATAPHPSGVAVVRVSGPAAARTLRELFKPQGRHPLDHPRSLCFGRLLENDGEVLDHGMAVFMPGPQSFTGEDVTEFHLHGSPRVAQLLLRSLFAMGVEPAEAGEFTKRAFLNGKLDLLQAEAVADMIEATSDAAGRLASSQLEGRLSGALLQLGEPLRDILAEVEAGIDFPEEDIDPADRASLLSKLESVQTHLARFIQSYEYGHVVREGFRVLLCGPPNAGKSSLLNAFLGRPRAIVTEIAGTTRDLIEETALLGGHRFVFCDSAGLTNAEDRVERIGVELAKERIPWADLVLLMMEAPSAASQITAVLPLLENQARRIWLVVNKIDLGKPASAQLPEKLKPFEEVHDISLIDSTGLPELVAALTTFLESLLPDGGDANIVITNERQRSCLVRAAEAVRRAVAAIKELQPPEILSIELRDALEALEELVGKTYDEDILGRIFSRFCVGK